MSLDQTLNFAKVIVSTGYGSADTSIALVAGQGVKLPTASAGNYNLVWWNATDFPDPSDDPAVEIVRVTVGGGTDGDTLTVTRAQEGTVASAKENLNKIYKMQLALTAKMISDLAAQTSNGTPIYNEIVSGSGTSWTLAHTPVPGTVRLYAGGNAASQTGRLAPIVSGNGDYSISGASITTNTNFAAGDLLADYSH
jgi:hypothetical protein